MKPAAMLTDGVQAPWRKDARIMAFIGFAHAVSHFFQLIITPIFPWLRSEFGYSYAELGFVMTVLFVVSAAAQAGAGFVVDRYGTVVTLLGGLLALALGAVGFGLSHSYAALLLSAGLVGLGNGVFHPVDYSVLNQRVSAARLGPAYSVHGVTGSLGWALAPIFLVTIATPYGWRAAVFAAALLPLTVIACLLVNRDLMPHETPTHRTDAAGSAALAFMRVPAVWWCFAFFFIVAAAISGIQNFAPTIFTKLYALDTAHAAMSISVYMLGSATGILTGGWWVMRSLRLERNITLALMLAIAGALLIGADVVAAPVAFALLAMMGFGGGLAGPSRDMLIRAAAPRGATGRVYGVVYSGLDFGIATGPVVFGQMLDHGYHAEVFWGIAVCMGAAILTAWRVATEAAR